MGHRSPGRRRRARTNARGHPGFYYSTFEGLSEYPFGDLLGKDIKNDILQLMNRSLSSDLVHGVVMQRRSAICSKVLKILPDLRRASGGIL